MHTQHPHRRALLSPLLLALCSAASAVVNDDDESPWFVEGGAEAGLDFVHQSGAKGEFWFPEIMGGGVALFDYDGDGDLDVYCVQSGDLTLPKAENAPNRLYRNDGGMKFTDVTDASGLGDRGYGMGVACGDYDNDGFVDVYVTNVGANALYHNEGDGTFTDVTAQTATGDVRWGTSAAFVDVNGDSFLDLFVVNNLSWSKEIEAECFNYNNELDYCSPNNYNARSTDILYLNNKRGGFRDWTQQAGILKANGNGLGVACGDFDQDGDMDVYVANDATENVLWKNDGEAKFENVALRMGCAVNTNGTPEAGMGVQFVDVDMDGDLDLFMTHLRRESNTFYRNERGRRFADRTNVTGTNLTSLQFTGFGMGFHDFDLDGQLDLYVANGAVQSWKQEDRFVPDDAYAEPNHLYRGRGGARFDEVPGGGVATPLIGTSRGAAFGDLDDDGDVDVVIIDRDARVKLLVNEAERQGAWVGFQVTAVRRGKLVRQAGASVRVKVNGEDRWRIADPAYSYLCSNDPRVHFGLGTLEEGEQVTGILVRFPGGREELFEDVAPGAYHELRMGKGAHVETPADAGGEDD